MKSNINGEEGGYYYEGDEDHLSVHHNEDGDLNDNHVEPELGTDQLINPDKRDIIDSDDGNPTVAEIKVLCLHTELTFVWHLINAVLQGLLEDPQYPVSENGGDYSDPGIPFDLRDYEAKSADTYKHIGGTTLHLGKINVGDKRY